MIKFGLQMKIVLGCALISSLALFQNCGSFSAMTVTNLQASSLSSTSTPAVNTARVTLAWVASPSVQTTGYIIQQSSDGVTFSEATRVGTVTTATVGNLVPGTNYTFRIYAYNAAGTSAPTATISASIPAKN